jgi:hypothetical protein
MQEHGLPRPCVVHGHPARGTKNHGLKGHAPHTARSTMLLEAFPWFLDHDRVLRPNP